MKKVKLTGEELTNLTRDINNRINTLTETVQINGLEDMIINSGLKKRDVHYFLTELRYKATHLPSGYVPATR